MTKQEIYEHLANVYLGKSVVVEKKKKKNNKRFIQTVTITLALVLSAFSVLSAFFVQRRIAHGKVMYALTNSLIRVPYDLTEVYPKIKDFSIPVPHMDASQYNALHFRLRGTEEGSPGVVHVVVTNARNESSDYFVKGVSLKWKEFSIPLSEFKEITDWSSVKSISFLLEEWNVDKKKGILLIDNVSFSS